MDWSTAFCIVGTSWSIGFIIDAVLKDRRNKSFEREFIEKSRKGWNAIRNVKVGENEYILPHALPLFIEEALKEEAR